MRTVTGRPILTSWRLRVCQEGGKLLLQREQWEAALEYTLVAWRYTSKLPQWDTPSHNSLREQCYRLLSAHGVAALRHRPLRADKAQELLRRYSQGVQGGTGTQPTDLTVYSGVGEDSGRISDWNGGH
ncbi:hypothetical protein JZ751_023589 [Albula glossodonta]|uniref:Uncharacterized protein n=1 Tax=Albula glossodonta TaxID=121402 RepID=A0A8T2NPB9_9TELE|nr:hypothetical protein JZ751_023589 [Albula glossodonta]